MWVYLEIIYCNYSGHLLLAVFYLLLQCKAYLTMVILLSFFQSRKILDNNYEVLPLHGLGKDHPANWWKALGDLLIANGIVTRTD